MSQGQDAWRVPQVYVTGFFIKLYTISRLAAFQKRLLPCPFAVCHRGVPQVYATGVGHMGCATGVAEDGLEVGEAAADQALQPQ